MNCVPAIYGLDNAIPLLLPNELLWLYNYFT